VSSCCWKLNRRPLLNDARRDKLILSIVGKDFSTFNVFRLECKIKMNSFIFDRQNKIRTFFVLIYNDDFQILMLHPFRHGFILI